jgi:Peptidase family M28
MRPLETIGALTAFERRGTGTDAERRAARWLAGELIAQRQRVRIETFWCRPNWALAHAWHVALALAGSLIAPSHPTVGVVLLAIALASIVTDEVAGISLGRRLTPERASQNVVSRAATPPTNTTGARRPLIVTANYDAGRTALIYRDVLRGPVARLRKRAGPAALGWLAWLSLGIVWLLVIAIVRTTTHHAPSALGAIQLPPTVALVLALALLLEAAGAPYGPAANDNASGSAVALTLAQALSATPPENVAVELVLAGAGEGGDVGIRTYLRHRRRELRGTGGIVLAIAPCGGGQLHYWVGDGRLFPLRYARPLRELAAAAQSARPHRGRGETAAFVGRALGLPAIAIGCLDDHGLPPRSHQPADTTDRIDRAALDQTLEHALQLVAAINATLVPNEPSPTPA